MDKYQETFETWNKVASLYQDKFMNLDLYNETYDFLCTLIPQNTAKLLDIGCGPGNITKYLLAKRPDFDILGIDIAPNMVALAQKNNPTAHFAVMDCRHIDEINTQYDAIVCGFCLPYISQEEVDTFITDCSNLLYEGGILYISFIEGDSRHSGFQTGSSGHRTDFYFYSTHDVKEGLLKNNLEILEVFSITYNKAPSEEDIHTVIIARK